MGLYIQFLLLAKEEEVITRDIELYNLYYRRFLHLRSEKLRNLHKVTTLSKAILIVNTDYPYKVCSLTKIKKRRGEAIGRKKGILQLVSLDICGPIPSLRLGFRYFLIIVDNYLRKKQGYPLKTREDATLALEAQKKKVESQIEIKLQAVRCNNAGELLKVLKQQEKEFSININLIEAYNSIQNRIAKRYI